MKYNAKKVYFHELLDDAKNSEDRRATWDIINKVFGKKKKKKTYPEKVNIGDSSNPISSEHPKDIADVLNVHFSNVATTLAKNLQKTNLKHTHFMGRENSSSMYLKPIELHEILELIRKICIRKAKGYDGIPPR